MANIKKITLDYSETAITVYAIIRREADSFRLNDADGAFATNPADPYVTLIEDTIIKGRYELSESRSVWSDGRYTVAIYKQAGGSPSPVSDTIIGTGEMGIAGDTETTPLADKTVDLVWDEVLTGATHNIATSAGRRLRQLGAQSIGAGVSQGYEAGTTNTIKLDAGDTAPTRLYDECLLVIDGGTALGEGHHILSYDSITKIAVLDDNWITFPDGTSSYQIYASSGFDATTGRASGGSISTIILNNDAVALDDYYNDQIVYIPSGTGKGQSRKILDYVGATKTATVTPNWIVAPDANSAYMVYPEGAVALESSAQQILTETQSHPTLTEIEATTILAKEATLTNATYGLSALNVDLDTLLTRLSALRAGYLDNLSSGAVALESTLTAIKGTGWTTETLVVLAAFVDTLETVCNDVKITTDKFAFTGGGPYDVKATLDGETVVLASATHTGAVIPTVTTVTNDVGITQAGADKMWAKAIEGLTAEEIMRITLAALAGKRQGLGTAEEKYMAQNGVTPRITFSPDAQGNGVPTLNGAP